MLLGDFIGAAGCSRRPLSRMTPPISSLLWWIYRLSLRVLSEESHKQKRGARTLCRSTRVQRFFFCFFCLRFAVRPLFCVSARVFSCCQAIACDFITTPSCWVVGAVCSPLQEMEELKTSLRSKSDIDFLRKTLRQNYDRFISQGDGRVR